MKILLISHFFPPTHNAGAEKQCFSYAAGLKELGHEVQVVCAGSWNQGPQYWNGYTDEVYQGIPVRRAQLNWLAAPDINLYLYDSPVVEAHLDGWLDEWQPDLVHIFSMVTLSTSVVRPVKKRGLPLVMHLTDFWMLCPRITLMRSDQSLCDGQTSSWECLRCMLFRSKAYRGLHNILTEDKTAGVLTWVSHKPRISRLPGLRGMAMDMDHRKQRMKETFQAIDRVSASSNAVKRLFDASGIVPEPVRVIHTGHDLSWVKNIPEKTKSHVLRFGYIGQIVPHKGIHLLIEAFQAANCIDWQGRKVELQIFGDENHDPAYTTKLKEMIQPDAPIRFMGGFTHDQLGYVLARIDALVVPSQWLENNPRVVQEAFASQTPVIGSDVDGISEFIRHDVDGLLFAHESSESLREQICRLLVEPDLLARLQASIPPVRTIEDELAEVIRLYDELLEEMRIPHSL